ncbi:MarC family integral membrane protein [uncultured archaeon]|nr:MarC family integral membrane protein [uncultured archaeon]
MAMALDSYFITSLIALLVIINPLSTIGIFLSLTKGQKTAEQNRVAFLTSLVAFCVLFFFALTGLWLFKIYSITIDSFRIAGGIALLIIGLRMLFPTDEKKKQDVRKDLVYMVPLAIPMTSGPGAISTTVLLAGQVTGLLEEFTLWGAIFVACALNYLVLRSSERIMKVLGQEGLYALMRIMGLIVCAIGVQFITTGLVAVFPGLVGKAVGA